MNSHSLLRKIVRYKKFLIFGFIGVAIITTGLVVSIGFTIASVGSWAASELKQSWNSSSAVATVTTAESLSPIRERFVAVGKIGVERWLSSHLLSENYIALSSGFKCFEYLGGPSKTDIVDRVGVYLNPGPLSSSFNRYVSSDFYVENRARSANPNDCVNLVMNGI